MADQDKPTAKGEWSVTYTGPEDFDEYIGITTEDPALLAQLRENTVKALKQIGAKARPRKFNSGSGPRPATVVAPGGVSKTCPDHNTQMVVIPPGGNPGVSQHPGREGNYTSYWKCQVPGCKQR